MFIEILLENGILRETAEKMEAYACAVLEANTKFNLTRIIGEKEMAEGHFLDSLAPFQKGYIQSGDTVIDIGTGAGFPGVPIAIYQNDVSVTLLDSSAKKTAFVEETCKNLHIPVHVVCARAEEVARFQGFFEHYDVAVSRAVARLNILVELCGAFVKRGGYFLAYKGPDGQGEINEAEAAAKRMGFSLEAVVDAGHGELRHILAVYHKIVSTPNGYPRKFTKIKNRPL